MEHHHQQLAAAFPRHSGRGSRGCAQEMRAGHRSRECFSWRSSAVTIGKKRNRRYSGAKTKASGDIVCVCVRECTCVFVCVYVGVFLLSFVTARS